ncbi:nuclear transport factor 2 family protein [Congregibacter litoralis]|uniref:SnoaL-like domain protein n=1 Tax=Congregibacter litoralis KT71 TaxID=314285 RepID=A4AAV3_9GAMM|nr:nuclear transport factor 2 family protein [Congregibacter litoralis]EAQ96825.2 SnoaL-like domain protein [Congregibacter litoralis KT71]
MFRRVWVSLVAMLLLASASAFSDDRGELAALLDEFLAGASVNDVAVHQRLWAEDLIYTSSSGARYGKASIIEGMGEPPAPNAETPVYTADKVNINLLDSDIAVVTFRLVAESPDGTVDYFLNTGVFEQKAGQWRASTWQATRVPE